MGYEGGFTFYNLDGVPEGSIKVSCGEVSGDVLLSGAHQTGHGSVTVVFRFESAEALELAGALKMAAAADSVELGEAS